jgi:GAF domain-containing protein
MKAQGQVTSPAPASRAERDLDILARVARAILAGAGLDDQLRLTLSLAAESLGASKSSILLADPATGELAVSCSTGLADAPMETVEPGASPEEWVAEHNQPFIKHSTLCLPLSAEGRVLGVLSISRPQARGRFSVSELRLASVLADLAALAMQKDGA